MKRQRFYGCTAVLIAMLLTGCAADKYETSQKEVSLQASESSAAISIEIPEASAERITEFPTQYTKDAGTVQFSTDITAGENGKVKGLSEYKATAMTPVHDPVYQAFFSQTELKDTQILEGENNGKSTGTSYYYHGTGGESLSILEAGFRYYSAFAFQVLNSFSLEKGQNGYNADLYQTNTDFPFQNHEEAANQILEQMNALGFSLDDGAYQYRYYSLDYATLEKEESILDMDGNQDTENYKDHWGEEDNCYYFSFRQKLDGIPVAYAFAGAFTDYNDGNAPLQAIVSKDGIQMLAMDRWFQIAETSAPAELLDFDRIADGVSKRFGDLLTASVYDVNTAQLAYWAFQNQQGGYTMKPVWIFEITENSQDAGNLSSLQMIIDAQTGEEIVL